MPPEFPALLTWAAAMAALTYACCRWPHLFEGGSKTWNDDGPGVESEAVESNPYAKDQR